MSGAVSGAVSGAGDGDGVLLVTAWHLPSMRRMPRAFRAVRALDRASQGAPGLRWMHRWVSRRSVLLTSTWASEAAAWAWLASAAFREADEGLRAIAGVTARVELGRTGK